VAAPDGNGNFVGTTLAPTDPFLNVLAANGGPTRTHEPSPISLAVDAGNDALALDLGADGAPGGGDDSALITDQRGGLFTRFANTVDMGAVETQAPPLLQVDTNLDVDNGDLSVGNRSLRELLKIANDNAGLDTIFFDSQLASPISLNPALGPLVISDPLTILGPSPVNLLVIENVSATPFRLLDITSSAGDVSITNIVFSGGDAGTEDGGAIRFQSAGNLLISQSAFADNQAASGGAIATTNGRLSIASTTFDQNTATADGGAIVAKSAAISVSLANVTISGNSAGTSGGGLFSEDATLTIANSTLTLNSAVTSGGGIGLQIDSSGELLTVNNSIIAGNTSPQGTDFLAPANPAANLDVNFSLIGNNAGTSLTESTVSGGQPEADPDGNLIGGGANPVIDPLLSALADNGGPTKTHVPLEGSLAIDAGNATLFPQDSFDLDSDNNRFEFLPVDQRGAARAVGTTDLGAVELAPVPIITWSDPAPIGVGTPLSDLQLNATSSAAGTFTYTPSAGTILNAGNDQVLTAVFNPANPLAFRSVTTTVQIDVTKSDPVITWANPPAIDFGTALNATQLNATADVPGTFVYNPVAGTRLDAGTQTLSVTFTPTNIANFNVVTKTVSLVVNPVDPVVTWNNPAGITFGTPLSATQLNAMADTTGTFVYTPASGTVLDAGTRILSVTFTPDDDNFNEVTKTVTILVAKANPVITWSNPADIGGGTPLGATQLDATANVPGTFVYNPVAGTVLSGGNNQPLMVTFTPTDATNYNQATATVFINVAVGEDFGDAPSQYPVTLAANGARHTTSSLVLGSAIDAEADGQPSTAADGDAADEDGVTVIADAVVNATTNTSASFLVQVSEVGKLDAWIDFNGDGDWSDTGEQIATSADLTAGDNIISFTIPSTASTGTTAARFRVSTAGGLAPTGAAPNGEVEDYIVSLFDGSSAPTPSINLPNSSATVQINTDNLVILDNARVLFSAPTTGLGEVDVQAGSGDDTVTLGFSGGPAGGMSIDGLAGANSLVVTGTNIDFTSAGLVAAQNFQVIDLTSTGSNVIVINATAVAAMSPADKTISVVGGALDAIVFRNPADWRLTAPQIIGGEFVQTVTNQETGEVVLVRLPGSWQNPIETSDVNNNGTVTAGDALVIINELGRRLFSNAQGQLNDPTTVTPWPGTYYDQNGDGKATALDALRVINRLTQINNSGEGELVSAQQMRIAMEQGSAAVSEYPAAILTPTQKLVGVNSPTGISTPGAAVAPNDVETPAENWAAAVDEFLSEAWSLGE
jgi:predicted outer membrane repeat protein